MKKIRKYFALLTALATLFTLMPVAAIAAETDPLDLSLVFSPEAQLVVYADGEWDTERSGVYGAGEYVTLTAPDVPNKNFSHWEADGSVISYDNPLKLTLNANTTLYAVYASSAPAQKAVAGFTSITRSTDGNSIVLQAIASGETAGIVYSTSATGDALKSGGSGVTDVAAEKITNNSTELPASVMDNNKCYSYKITPESADTVYHVRAYVTVGGTTTYGDEKTVKLSDLQSGISLVANLEGFEPGTNDLLASLTTGMHTVTYFANGGVGATITQAYLGESVTLRANSFTREGYTFSGWSTEEKGGGTTYTDGQTVTLSEDITLYAQWRSNSSGGGGSSGTTYAPTVSNPSNGTVSINPTSPKSGDKVTIRVKPDAGYATDTVTVTDANGKTIPVTKNADGSYTYTQPAGNVTVDATFAPVSSDVLEPFTDVNRNGWYADALRWAINNGVMNGLSSDTFAPDGDTTRAMIVTMLWRMEGSPTVNYAMSFPDVAEETWYTEAVRWANASRIVTGYSDGRFGSSDPVTREQLAAILYRYAQVKGEDVSKTADLSAFNDAASVSSWATSAMQWAVGSGIINGGANGSLVPAGNATRAQVATMLMRYSTAK